jgi:hypothetical protein
MNRSKQMSELEKLKAQNVELADRIAKLEAAAKPPELFKSDYRGPIDYTAGMSMPKSAMLDLIKNVPDALMKDLRADARKPSPAAASTSPISSTPAAQSQSQRRGSGWRDEVPLGPPPGIEHCDRLVDAQDAKDRAELIERELKLAKARMGK